MPRPSFTILIGGQRLFLFMLNQMFDIVVDPIFPQSCIWERTKRFTLTFIQKIEVSLNNQDLPELFWESRSKYPLKRFSYVDLSFFLYLFGRRCCHFEEASKPIFSGCMETQFVAVLISCLFFSYSEALFRIFYFKFVKRERLKPVQIRS